MAYNEKMKNQIITMMKEKKCNDFEIDIMCDTVEHLYKLYGNELNDFKILINIQNIEKVSAIDKDTDVDYAGCMKMKDDGKCEVVYKKYDDKEYIRSVLTHEFIHALSNKVYDNEYITGVKEAGKDRALNESLTESFTENVLESQGINRDFGTASYYDVNDNVTYVYPLTSDSYQKVTPYGDLLIEVDKNDFARNYFTSADEDFLDSLNAVSRDMRYVLYEETNSTDLRYGKDYVDEYDKLNKSFCKLLSKDGDFKSDENSLFFDFFDKKYVDNSRYFELMDKVKDLPGMSDENLRYLDYNKFTDRSKVDLDDYLNKNSNLNQSLDILEIVRNNFKDKNIDVNNIEFSTITDRRDSSQSIVFSVGDGKKYLFNREDVINNDFKIVEYNKKIDLNKKMFGKEDYNIVDNIKDGTILNDIVNGVKDKVEDVTKKLNASDYDFKELVKISNKSNWLEQIDNDFSEKDRVAFNFIKNEKINVSDLVLSKDFEDKSGNNIMHLMAYKNYSDNNISSFNDVFSPINFNDKMNLIEEKQLKETFKELLKEKNSEGLTPFDEAVQNDNKDSIIFLSKIIDEYDIKDYSSGTVKFIDNDCFETILEEAKEKNNYSVAIKMVKSLQNDNEGGRLNFLEKAVEEGITSNKFWKEVDVEDINFISKNNGNFVNILTGDNDVDYKLIKNVLSIDGVNVNEVSYHNRTPLHNMLLNDVCKNDEKNKIIDLLIDKGADVNAECNIRYSILKKSTGLPPTAEDYKEHPVLGKRLMLSEDEIEKIPSTITSLQIASGIYGKQYKDYNSASKLIEAGADIKKETKEFISPLEAAHIDGDVKMFKVFIENGYSTKELFEGYDNSKLTNKMKDDLKQYEIDCQKENNFKNDFNSLFKKDENNFIDKFKNMFSSNDKDNSKDDVIEKESNKFASLFDKDGNGKMDVIDKIFDKDKQQLEEDLDM